MGVGKEVGDWERWERAIHTTSNFFEKVRRSFFEQTALGIHYLYCRIVPAYGIALKDSANQVEGTITTRRTRKEKHPSLRVPVGPRLSITFWGIQSTVLRGR